MSFEERLGEVLKWTILVVVVAMPTSQLPWNTMPALEHWATPGTVGVFVAIVFAVISTFVGVKLMSLDKKWYWGVGISGFAVFFVGSWILAENHYRASNYCYFTARLDLPQPGGGYEWAIHNDQGRTILNMQMCRYEFVDGDSVDRGCWDVAQCHTDTVNQTTAGEDPIGLGIHHFKFGAANDWEQRLEIREAPNGATQSGTVFRGDKVLRIIK